MRTGAATATVVCSSTHTPYGRFLGADNMNCNRGMNGERYNTQSNRNTTYSRHSMFSLSGTGHSHRPVARYASSILLTHTCLRIDLHFGTFNHVW